MSWVGCPRGCGSAHFHIEQAVGEYVLVCNNGHELRRFFVLVPPDPPAHPERSEHAAAEADPAR